MSANKRTSVRSKKAASPARTKKRTTGQVKKTTKQAVSKAAVKKVVKKTKKSTPVRTTSTKKTVKKVAQAADTAAAQKTTPQSDATATGKHAKKTTKKVVKKVTKKITKKVVTRVVKRPKNATADSVRAARYGGHTNTLPTNPTAPGRLLGRTFTLSLVGVFSWPINWDVVVIQFARLGGVAIMLAGLALSWHLHNTIVTNDAGAQMANVIETQQPAPVEPTLAVATKQPVTEEAPLVITAEATQVIVSIASPTLPPYILGAATQRTETTWEMTIPAREFPAGSYTLRAYVANDDSDVSVISAPLVIESATPPVAVTSSSTASSSVAIETATSSRPATTTATQPPATTSTPILTERMPVLYAPSVHLLVPQADGSAVVLGEGTPGQPLEILVLREQLRATTTVQDNGWWWYQLALPEETAVYELYAQASPELLSGPLDFSVISGRLHRQSDIADTQKTSLPTSGTDNAMLMWYLVAAVAVVGLGAVILLLGHYLHHDRKAHALDPAP